MSTVAEITANMADGALNAIRDLILDGTGDFELQIWTAAFATKLCEFAIAEALLAAAAAGSTGKRAIEIDCDPDIATVGLAAGTAAKWRIVSQVGTKRCEGDAGGIGSGHGVILSNTSIAVDQPVNLLTARIQMPFTVTE